MSYLRQVYRDSLSLLTDLYEITMAYAYWKNGGEDRQAVFQLFFRQAPFGGSFAVCAGLQPALEFVESFRFQSDDLAYLESIKNAAGAPLFEAKFLQYLQDFRMTLDIDAMEEGTLAFAYEPLLRVQGPIIQAQLLESILLNIINFQTLIATKASRICLAAAGDHVVEFGLRRAQGIDGALSASRAAFIGGCHSTSNVLAGKLFSIPVVGTHAHSWVMTFEEEKEAFFSFARAMPKNCVFLIDTYHTLSGAKYAIEVAKELKEEGIVLLALRLDSGDLGDLSRKVRKLLDEAGLLDVKIMATNQLTEHTIADLKRQGAPISIWGVGTHLVTAKDQPALDGVYKLTAIQDVNKNWQYKIKVSDQVIKTTHPGISQVRRFFDGTSYVADMLYDLETPPSNWIVNFLEKDLKKQIDPHWQFQDLLLPMVRKGKITYAFPSLEKVRLKTYEELKKVDKSLHHLSHPTSFFAGMEANLFEKKQQMIQERSS